MGFGFRIQVFKIYAGFIGFGIFRTQNLKGFKMSLKVGFRI